MKIGYNSPVVLTYSLLAAAIVGIASITHSSAISYYFITPKGSLSNPVAVFQLFSHVLGHSGWDHLIANLTIMLLVGPLLEEKYGSFKIFEMFMVTAFFTGIINYFAFDSRLLGGSGLVFMLILLSSFANFRAGKIPLTLILVAGLFLGKEILNSFQNDQISQFAHIAGGFIGSIYGFMRVK